MQPLGERAVVGNEFVLGDLERVRMYVGNAVIYARVGHPLAGASTLAQIVDAEWVVTSRRHGAVRESPVVSLI